MTMNLENEAKFDTARSIDRSGMVYWPDISKRNIDSGLNLTILQKI